MDPDFLVLISSGAVHAHRWAERHGVPSSRYRHYSSPDRLRGLDLVPERVLLVGPVDGMRNLPEFEEVVNACCARSGRRWQPFGDVGLPDA